MASGPGFAPQFTYGNGLGSYSLIDYINATNQAADYVSSASNQIRELSDTITKENKAYLEKQNSVAQETLKPFLNAGKAGIAGLKSYITSGQQATTAMQNLLGLNGAAGNNEQNTALSNMLNSPMIASQMKYGMEGVQGQLAAQGLTGSGAALKQLNEYGQGIAANQIGNYMNALGQQSGYGLQAASALAQSGGQAAGVSANSSNQLGMNVAEGNLQNLSTQGNALMTSAQAQSQATLSNAQMSLMAAMGGFPGLKG